MTDQRFNPLAADKRWQKRWADSGVFEADLCQRQTAQLCA